MAAPAAEPLTVALDANGADAGPAEVARGAALAAAGGVVLATSISEFNNAKDNKKCPDGVLSECMAAADTVKSRNLISKILFVGGALAAVAGGVALVVSPGSSNESASALPNELTVALRGRF